MIFPYVCSEDRFPQLIPLFSTYFLFLSFFFYVTQRPFQAPIFKSAVVLLISSCPFKHCLSFLQRSSIVVSFIHSVRFRPSFSQNLEESRRKEVYHRNAFPPFHYSLFHQGSLSADISDSCVLLYKYLVIENLIKRLCPLRFPRGAVMRELSYFHHLNAFFMCLTPWLR